MAKYTVKYPVSSKVQVRGLEGVITAVTIRGRSRLYEFSFNNKDNTPVIATVDECEIDMDSEQKIGFRGK